jgi:hypothetical protein
MLGATAKLDGLDGPGSRSGLLRQAALVASGVVLGVVANQAFFYATQIGVLSRVMPSAGVASATVGVSIVFSTALILAVWSHWIARRETAEAVRDLAEVERLVATGLAQAERIAAIGRTLRDSDGVASHRDR